MKGHLGIHYWSSLIFELEYPKMWEHPQDDAQRDLDEALPALDQAARASAPHGAQVLCLQVRIAPKVECLRKLKKEQPWTKRSNRLK